MLLCTLYGLISSVLLILPGLLCFLTSFTAPRTHQNNGWLLHPPSPKRRHRTPWSSRRFATPFPPPFVLSRQLRGKRGAELEVLCSSDGKSNRAGPKGQQLLRHVTGWFDMCRLSVGAWMHGSRLINI